MLDETMIGKYYVQSFGGKISYLQITNHDEIIVVYTS